MHVVAEGDRMIDQSRAGDRATGRSEYFSTGFPFGRPKCAIKIVFAPCSRR